MIRKIVHDQMLLRMPSEPATKADLPIGEDLKDTLEENLGSCVGMAANMIGERKRIIVIASGYARFVMYNPVITAKKDPFEAEEGCLSLPGTRKTIRYKEITVQYQDERFVKHTGVYRSWTAQIIQHEIDHCNGILI